MWDDLDTPWVGRALLVLVGVAALGVMLSGFVPWERHDILPVEVVPGFFSILGLTVTLGIGLAAGTMARFLAPGRGADDA